MKRSVETIRRSILRKVIACVLSILLMMSYSSIAYGFNTSDEVSDTTSSSHTKHGQNFPHSPQVQPCKLLQCSTHINHHAPQPLSISRIASNDPAPQT